MKYIIFAQILVFYLSCFDISAQTNNKTDKPKSGEGVNAFLERNGYAAKTYYNDFVELNKSKLGKNNSLKTGVKYTLPTKKAKSESSKKSYPTKKEPLFGKDWEEYEIVSDKLKGACFYLVSGHGGIDPGAVAKVDGHVMHEDEYAYDIMLRLARELLMHSATVHIIIQDKDGIRDDKFLANSTTETCMGKPIPNGWRARLRQRANKVNELYDKSKAKYQRAIFIHIDYRANQDTRVDAYFIYHKNSTKGQKLAETLRDELKAQYQIYQPNRAFRGKVEEKAKEDIYVLGVKPVCAYAELGNINNSNDRQRFLLSSNRQHLAKWMALGLMKDYENNKKKKK